MLSFSWSLQNTSLQAFLIAFWTVWLVRFFNLYFLRVTFASSVFKSSSKSPKCHLKKADSSAAFTNIFLNSVQKVTICSNQQDIRKIGALSVSLGTSQAVTHCHCRRDSLCEAELLWETETLLSSTNWKIIFIMKSPSQLHFLASSITFGITQLRLPLEVWKDSGNFLFPLLHSITKAKIKCNTFCHMKDNISLPIWMTWSIINLAEICHMERQKTAIYKPICIKRNGLS